MIMDRSNATTGLAVLLAVILLLVGYAIYRNGQSHKSNSSKTQTTAQVGPKLSVGAPSDNATVSASKVSVKGTTDKGDSVTVNDQPVTVDKDGNFSTSVALSDTDNFVFIKARSSAGKETVIERKVVYTPGGQTASAQPQKNSAAAAQQQTAKNNAAATVQLGKTGPEDPFVFLGIAAIGAGYYQLRRSRKQLSDTITG
jgi:hypothetical protein